MGQQPYKSLMCTRKDTGKGSRFADGFPNRASLYQLLGAFSIHTFQEALVKSLKVNLHFFMTAGDHRRGCQMILISSHLQNLCTIYKTIYKTI